MIEIKSEIEPVKGIPQDFVPLSFHHTFYPVYQKLQQWVARFSQTIDHTVFNDLFLLHLVATRKFLDHRGISHLFRLVMSIYLAQKKLLRKTTFSSQQRHLKLRWMSTSLRFPFSSKPVLSCLIGFNVMDRYELFDEENIVLALEKHLPELRFVKESFYHHPTQHKNLKIFYFEIEKKDGSTFSIEEKRVLKSHLEEKVKNSIQKLSPAIYMGFNEEEIYKNILVLSQEIQSPQDLPQANITLDQQTGKEIVFRVTLVYISPFHRFSLNDCFSKFNFVSQRVLTVRHIENHPIEANIFHLRLPRDPTLLRSDGSLDFYAARQKVASLIHSAIGEFRDYNGGIIIKQQELLQSLKENFPEIAKQDPELMETFFYALMPLEKQAVLSQEILTHLFTYYLENRREKLSKDVTYILKTYQKNQRTYLVVHAEKSSLTTTLLDLLNEQSFSSLDIAYNVIDSAQGVFFSCVFLGTDTLSKEMFMQALTANLEDWQKKLKERQVLKIALGYPVLSLDPRIGGESISAEVLRFLFEGLTRFDEHGNIENAVAEEIHISSDRKKYTFKLRHTLWNDNTPVSALDFEYAWKKILSPDFKTAFTYLFYPIKNAREAKEGRVSLDQVGIHVIDDYTLEVQLESPVPYFLQLTALHLYSPVHRLVDQEHPQWPYQSDKNYPCNGPFELMINQPHQGYQLTKNNLYWDRKHISLEQVTFTIMNNSQAIQAFQRNEINWFGNPFGVWDLSVNTDIKDNMLVFSNCLRTCWCVFNTTYPPFQNRKLRKAFAYAIEREEFTQGPFSHLQPAYSPLQPHYFDNNIKPFPEMDKEKACQLLEEGLNELGLTKQNLEPLTILCQERGVQRFAALCLQKQFKKILNLECELVSIPWSEHFSKMTKGQFQLGLIQWSSWVDDAIYTLNAFKSAKDDVNFAKWENEEFKHLLDLSEHEIDPVVRNGHLLKAKNILCEEIPVLPLFYSPSQAVVSKNLFVFRPSPCGYMTIARSYFKKMENQLCPQY